MPEAFNPAVMPGDNMSPDVIDAAAAGMSTVGTGVSAQGGSVLTAWQKISASYDAPEERTLFAAMDPVKTEAERFGTDVGTVATALETFAEEVRTIKAAVAAIRVEAATFLAGIADGVEKTNVGAYGVITKETIPWHEDQASVDANNALRTRTADQQEALWAAERRCANAIYDVIGHAHVEAASDANGGQGYGVDQIPDGVEMPWGKQVQRTEQCGEKVVRGVGDGASALVGGFAGFAGFSYEPGSDLWDWKWDHSWSTSGETFKGLGIFAVGVATLAVPGGRIQAALMPGPVGDFLRDSQKSVDGLVAGLVAIDLYADDPLHKWKEDGWRALGEAGFNVGTLFVAPTKLGNVGRAGRVVRIAAKATDVLYLAEQAARAARALAGPTMETLARLTRAADLDGAVKVHPVEIPSVTREHVSTDVPNTGGHPGNDAPPPREHPAGADHDLPGTRDDVPRSRDDVPGSGHDVPGSRDDVPSSGSHQDGPAAHPGSGVDAPSTEGPASGGSDDAGRPHGHGDAPSGQGDGSRPAEATPTNDPALAKSDPVVRSQVDQIRSDLGPELQRQADDAWQRAVERADSEGITNPSAQRLGTYAHTEFDRWFVEHGDTLVDPDQGYRVRTEASFDQLGRPTDVPEKGSIRPDLVIERENARGAWQVVHVVDLKTGNAGISATWERAVQQRLNPLYPSETLRPHKLPVATK